MYLKRKILSIFVLALALIPALLSCGRSDKTLPDVTALLGPYTATGTITATGAALYRRGTHLLSMNGRPRFFLESKTVSLNEFQGAYVVVQGELSPNTDPKFLPVIQVGTVQKADAPSEEEMQKYTVDSLKISLDAPRIWKSTITGERLIFTLASETESFIAIGYSADPVIPEGVPVRINGQNGVRVVEEGNHHVFVHTPDEKILLFTFGPKGEESMKERDAFYTLLQSVEFKGGEKVPEEEFKGSRQPCGGSAGVLCPTGEYCEVKEIDTGIGICRAL